VAAWVKPQLVDPLAAMACFHVHLPQSPQLNGTGGFMACGVLGPWRRSMVVPPPREVLDAGEQLGSPGEAGTYRETIGLDQRRHGRTGGHVPHQRIP
jgi:hypothetical protein